MLSVRLADTFCNWIQTAFEARRNKLKQSLVDRYESLPLSLDVWTSEYQLAVLAIAGHEVISGFRRRGALLELAMLRRAHSGENMAALVYIMFNGSRLATTYCLSQETV